MLVRQNSDSPKANYVPACDRTGAGPLQDEFDELLPPKQTLGPSTCTVRLTEELSPSPAAVTTKFDSPARPGRRGKHQRDRFVVPLAAALTDSRPGNGQPGAESGDSKTHCSLKRSRWNSRETDGGGPALSYCDEIRAEDSANLAAAPALGAQLPTSTAASTEPSPVARL